MQKTILYSITASILLMLPCVSIAQGNLLQSPYTMYGLGQMESPASISSQMMGGVGVASVNAREINYLNPASLGVMPQKSALFSIAGINRNYYSKATSQDLFGNPFTAKAANNSITLNDVGFAIPLAAGVGFSISLNPVSTVGYNTTLVDASADMSQNIGRTIYDYSGNGGISAATASVGVKVAKGLTLGASLHYYFGSIDRAYNANVYPILNSESFFTVKSYQRMELSRILGSFGLQYSARVSKTGAITFGATYQLQAKTQATLKKEHMIVRDAVVDTIEVSKTKKQVIIPQKFNVGIAFQSAKTLVEFNYSRQDWRNTYDTDPANTNVKLAVQQDFRLGASFTPNKQDIRHFLNRWTYRVGVRYGTSYLMKDNYNMHTAAVSIGLDIPLKYGNATKVQVGFEYGQQGTLNNNQVRDQFFKVFLGFTFAGDNMWFEKRKFE